MKKSDACRIKDRGMRREMCGMERPHICQKSVASVFGEAEIHGLDVT